MPPSCVAPLGPFLALFCFGLNFPGCVSTYTFFLAEHVFKVRFGLAGHDFKVRVLWRGMFLEQNTYTLNFPGCVSTYTLFWAEHVF